MDTRIQELEAKVKRLEEQNHEQRLLIIRWWQGYAAPLLAQYVNYDPDNIWVRDYQQLRQETEALLGWEKPVEEKKESI